SQRAAKYRLGSSDLTREPRGAPALWPGVARQAAARRARQERAVRGTAMDVVRSVGDPLLRLSRSGTVELRVATLRRLAASWHDDERIEQLLRRLERIDGVAFTANRPRWPVTPLAPLADPTNLTRL